MRPALWRVNHSCHGSAVFSQKFRLRTLQVVEAFRAVRHRGRVAAVRRSFSALRVNPVISIFSASSFALAAITASVGFISPSYQCGRKLGRCRAVESISR
jgi:hypothetical protein